VSKRRRIKSTRIRLEGVEDLEAKLKQLGEIGRKDSIYTALERAAAPMAAAVRQNAPRGKTGNLVGSVKVVRVSEIGRGSRGRKAKGPTVELGHAKPKGSHAHLVERGTKQRSYKVKKTGKMKNVGAMPAKPYMRPAYDSTKDQVVKLFAAEARRLVLEVAE